MTPMTLAKLEELEARVEALEADFSFAAGKCAEGLHTITLIVRERGARSVHQTGESVVVRELFLSCTHCSRLFGLQTNMLGGIHVEEYEIDREKLDRVRGRPPEDRAGEVIETELLDAEEIEIPEESPEDDDGTNGSGGLHRF